MTSNFHFLATEWPEVLEPAAKAESLAYSDPRAACFYTRRALEMAMAWLYKHDATLRLPYQDSLNALLGAQQVAIFRPGFTGIPKVVSGMTQKIEYSYHCNQPTLCAL